MILLVFLTLLMANRSFIDSFYQFIYLLLMYLWSFGMSSIIKLHRKTQNNKALWEWTNSLSNQLPSISYLNLTDRTLKNLNLIRRLLTFQIMMAKQRKVQTWLKMPLRIKLMPYKLQLFSYPIFKQEKPPKLLLWIAFLSKLLIFLMVLPLRMRK